MKGLCRGGNGVAVVCSPKWSIGERAMSDYRMMQVCV